MLLDITDPELTLLRAGLQALQSETPAVTRHDNFIAATAHETIRTQVNALQDKLDRARQTQHLGADIEQALLRVLNAPYGSAQLAQQHKQPY